MPRFVVALSLEGRPCLVVGGDADALRRAQRLHACGGRVRSISEAYEPDTARGFDEAGIARVVRRPTRDDVQAMRPFVAVSTPRDEGLSRDLATWCAETGALLCCVDQPAHSNWAHTAIVDAGELTVGISSGGTAPSLLVRLRDALTAGFDDEFADFTRHLAALRARTEPARRRAVLDAALEGLRVELRVTLPKWR